MKQLLFFLFTISFLDSAGQQQRPASLRAFMQSSPSPGNAIPYGANEKNGGYVNSGDAKIYYEVYGKGKPLVILHGGIVGSTFEMREFIDSLSKSFQVIAVSTRGHGKSSMGSGIPTYLQKAQDVNAVIEAVTKDRVILLGFSDGAYTGYFLAASNPEKVQKVIAIGAGVWRAGFRNFNNSRKALFTMDSLFFKQQLALMPQPQKWDEWLEKGNRYYNTLNIGKETFGAIKCPVLVMAGESDENAPLKTVIAAYEMIPNGQLSIIPGAPHPVFLVNFPAVWESMKPFLNQ
jgi:pimeloyl-ACP methyl ester carboxylesterase